MPCGPRAWDAMKWASSLKPSTTCSTGSRSRTALRENEERVRAVVNSALSAVIVTDRAGAITDWNTRAEMISGWRGTKRSAGRWQSTVIAPSDRETFGRALERPLLASPSAQENLADPRRGPAPRSARISGGAVGEPLKTADGVMFCSFITDITERLRAEERLHAQLARLNLLNRITRAIGERQDLPSIFQVVIVHARG